LTTQNAPVPGVHFADQLEGLTLGEWFVKERLERADPKDGLSGGYFSVGYIVTRNGQKAFLKAFDLERVLEMNTSLSPMQGLLEMTAAFQFERSTLHTAKRMDRVIDILDDGDAYVEPGNTLSLVPYIIMEKADHDVRCHLRDVRNVSVQRRLHLLHHVAIGLMQLHNARIAHQDLKPSNILVWEKGGAKLGDLGRASIRGAPSANDLMPFAGARSYAPPEALYNHLNPDWDRRRYPIDLFLFGSVIVFLFTQTSMAGLMLETFLAEEHRPQEFWQGKWTGTFVDVLPYLENAFVDAVSEFERNLPPPSNPRKDYRTDLVQMVHDMCHPDPEKRGTLVRGGERTYALNRAVTILNRLYYDA
jgi:serine/threonine protein kinase